MSDFRSLGYYEATGSVYSFSVSGLDTTPYSVLEIHAEFKTDYAAAADWIRVNCSSGQGQSGQNPNTNNSGVSYVGPNTSVWTSTGHSTNNEILMAAQGTTGNQYSNRTGHPSRMLVFNPVTNVGGRDRALSIWTCTTPGYGGNMTGQTYGDINVSFVSWPRPTSSPEASLTSFTFSPVWGTNIAAGSWLAVYGYYQE